MRTLIDGVTPGIVGAITLAGWFLMLDVARGQPFATPALLGATLMHGAVDPRLAHVTWTLVVEYSVIHVTAFVASGWSQHVSSLRTPRPGSLPSA